MGLRMSAGNLQVRELAGSQQVRLASIEPVFLPKVPPGAASLFTNATALASAPSGSKAVFDPKGESLGYLRPDAQLVVQPGYTSDLTRPFPAKLIQLAMARIDEKNREDAVPVFDVNGGYVGYLAGPSFHSGGSGRAGAGRAGSGRAGQLAPAAGAGAGGAGAGTVLGMTHRRERPSSSERVALWSVATGVSVAGILRRIRFRDANGAQPLIASPRSPMTSGLIPDAGRSGRPGRSCSPQSRWRPSLAAPRRPVERHSPSMPTVPAASNRAGGAKGSRRPDVDPWGLPRSPPSIAVS